MKGIAKLAKKSAALLISIVLLFSLTPALADSILSGDGTDASPYLITSPADLLYVSEQVDKSVQYAQAAYKLSNDIDLSQAGDFPGIGQFHDGNKSYWFHGHFDGAGHKILYYSSHAEIASAFAFFPYTSDGAVIENITFIDPDVENASQAAVVTGWSYGSNIRNVKVYNGIVEARLANAGGISVGLLGSHIEQCSVLDTTVTSTLEDSLPTSQFIGGIAALIISGSSVSDCEFRGAAYNNAQSGQYAICVGGIVGYASSSSEEGYPKGARIENCLATGDVYANTSYSIGGIAGVLSDGGSSNAIIKNCISETEIASNNPNLTGSYAGGIVGSLEDGNPSVEGSLAVGSTITAVGGQLGRIFASKPATVNLAGKGNMANSSMLLNGAYVKDSELNGIGVANASILDGSALPDQFKQSPWGFKPGSLPYLIRNEEVTEDSEVILKAPQSIQGDKGTELKAVLWLGKWAEGIKALDAVLSIPEGLELVSVKASESLSGGSPSFELDSQGKLRIAYMNTESDQISLTLGQTISPALEITLKLKKAMNEGDIITLSADSVRLIASASVDPITLDVSKAVSTTEISEGGTENPTIKARELYIGDGVDLISNDVKAIAVEVTGLDEIIGLRLGDEQFFYAPEFELATTYIALVSKAAPLSLFEDYDAYTKEQGLSEVLFGKASGPEGPLNAQHALMILSFWLRKAEPDGDKGILASNVSADGRIDTIDALAVVERFVSQVPFAILSK